MQKNDVVKVTIEDIGVNGEGSEKLTAIRCLSRMRSSVMWWKQKL